MEKLIELLNEYAKQEFEKHTNAENELWVWKEIITEAYDEEVIISKRYGFIKWLVENEKIDNKKIDTRLVRNVESHYDEDGCWVENSYEDYSNTNTLLMLLAIEDEPINFLISILK